MELLLPFGEAANFVKTKTGQQVFFSFVDEKSVNIGTVFKMTVPLINKEVVKEISIKVSDIQLMDEVLQLHYDAGMMSLLSSALAKFLPTSVMERGIVEFVDNSTVVIHLNKVEKAHQVLQHVDIQAIRFNETAAVIDFTLRLQ